MSVSPASSTNDSGSLELCSHSDRGLCYSCISRWRENDSLYIKKKKNVCACIAHKVLLIHHCKQEMFLCYHTLTNYHLRHLLHCKVSCVLLIDKQRCLQSFQPVLSCYRHVCGLLCHTM